jgi:hypothetical protein
MVKKSSQEVKWLAKMGEKVRRVARRMRMRGARARGRGMVGAGGGGAGWRMGWGLGIGLCGGGYGWEGRKQGKRRKGTKARRQ